MIVDRNPRGRERFRIGKRERSRHLAIEAVIRLRSRTGNGRRTNTGHASTTSTARCPAWRINAEDPAYAEETGSYGYPDPPRKPFPPRCSQRRRISGHLAITHPAGGIPEAATCQRGS